MCLIRRLCSVCADRVSFCSTSPVNSVTALQNSERRDLNTIMQLLRTDCYYSSIPVCELWNAKNDENGFSTCVAPHANCQASWVRIKFYNQIMLLHKNSGLFTIKWVCPGQQSRTCVFCVWDLALINPLAWPPLPLINTAIRANSQWPGEMVHIWERSVSHTDTQTFVYQSTGTKEYPEGPLFHRPLTVHNTHKHTGTLCLSSAQVVFSLSGFTMLVVSRV